jgi:hypothetical protein
LVEGEGTAGGEGGGEGILAERCAHAADCLRVQPAIWGGQRCASRLDQRFARSEEARRPRWLAATGSYPPNRQQAVLRMRLSLSSWAARPISP